MSETSDTLRQQIILAAVNAAGERYEDETPQQYEARVVAEARRIKVMTSPQSRVSRAIDILDECKVFPAVIEDIKKEASSTRGLVLLRTRPSKHSPDGKETVRTERTDNPEGYAMAMTLRKLIGHRVLLWVELEAVGDGSTKVRVLRHVEDLGVASDADSDAA